MGLQLQPCFSPLWGLTGGAAQCACVGSKRGPLSPQRRLREQHSISSPPPPSCLRASTNVLFPLSEIFEMVLISAEHGGAGPTQFDQTRPADAWRSLRICSGEGWANHNLRTCTKNGSNEVHIVMHHEPQGDHDGVASHGMHAAATWPSSAGDVKARASKVHDRPTFVKRLACGGARARASALFLSAMLESSPRISLPPYSNQHKPRGQHGCPFQDDTSSALWLVPACLVSFSAWQGRTNDVKRAANKSSAVRASDASQQYHVRRVSMLWACIVSPRLPVCHPA